VTRQEDISIGVYAVINTHSRGKLTPSERRRLRDALLEYENSQGMVMKVEDQHDLVYILKNECEIVAVEPLINRDKKTSLGS